MASLSQEQINISHMQCWLFRLAQSQWNKTPEETADLFQRYDVLSYIAELYDMLHLSSYSHALTDIEAMLRQKGVVLS